MAGDSQIPQRDEDVVAFSAFNGLRNDVNPERFDPGDLAVAQNINIDKSGEITRRDGFTLSSGGAAHSVWADDLQDVCLFVRAGMLRRLYADYSSQPVVALQAPDSRVKCARVNDRVYWGNGTDAGVYENGRSRTWGLPVAPLPAAASTFGAMPAGSYQFAMTWLRSDGQESGAPLAGVLALTDGAGISFTAPVSPNPDVVGKILYISAANGAVLYDCAHMANTDTQLTVAFDPATRDLELATQFLTPPPFAPNYVAFYRSRLFLACGDTLYWSLPHAPELFDPREYLQLDGRITMLAVLNDKDRQDTGRDSGFFIGTDRSVGILAGSDPRDFQYVQKANYGAIPGALDFVDGSLFRDGSAGARLLPMFLTTAGICVGMPQLEVNNLTRTKFSFPAAGRGAALFMPGPNRFLATANL